MSSYRIVKGDTVIFMKLIYSRLFSFLRNYKLNDPFRPKKNKKNLQELVNTTQIF